MKQQLVTAVLPLVLFWAIEEYWGLKAALVAGCVAAVGEILYELIRYRRVTFITLASNFLVLGLGALSYAMDSGVAFKLQPMAMELGMAGFMGVMAWRGGEAFFIKMFREFKAPNITEEQKAALLGQEWFLARLRSMERRLLIFFVFHGLAVGAAAVWGSTRLWILLKGVLFYVLLVLVVAPMYKRPTKTV